MSAIAALTIDVGLPETLTRPILRRASLVSLLFALDEADGELRDWIEDEISDRDSGRRD